MRKVNAQRAKQLKKQASALLSLADQIESDPHGSLVNSDTAPMQLMLGYSRQELERDLILDKARELYSERRRRKKYLPKELFGEPGWDLLLDLFAAGIENKQISITSACLAADVPQTTGLRWISVLEQSGLVRRHESDTDQRITWIELTEAAKSTMFDLFSEKINNNFERFDIDCEYLIIRDNN